MEQKHLFESGLRAIQERKEKLKYLEQLFLLFTRQKHNIEQKHIDIKYQMSLVRKPAFCICENKDADQLRGNREADQHLWFRYIDSTIPLLPKSEISSL